MTDKKKSKQTIKRELLRKEFWPDETPWVSQAKGWFKGPRSLPYVLALMKEKKIGGSKNPGPVYIELLARHMDSGLIEMESDADHAFGAGYKGSRAIRTWLERMKLLEDLGFIRTKQGGAQRYKYVLLRDLHTVVEELLKEKPRAASEAWRQAYFARRLETSEGDREEPTSIMAADDLLDTKLPSKPAVRRKKSKTTGRKVKL